MDIGDAQPILRWGIAGERRKLILNYAGEDRAGDRGPPGHTGHVVLSYHTEYLTGPCFYCLHLDPQVVGSDSL